MALETNHPKPKPPAKPAFDKDHPPNQEHDTTSGDRYGTTEGVKEGDEQFEQVLVPKKPASNAPDDDADEGKVGGKDKGKKK